jgi:hypothetical protein
MKPLLSLALAVLIVAVSVCFVTLCAGCVQREISYNPETGLVRYKSNHFATDASVESAEITLPGGTVIRFGAFRQDNDSLELYAPPYFWGKTKE